LELNVLNTPLQTCCTAPMTGYFRDGLCRTTANDQGTHNILLEATHKKTLEYTSLDMLTKYAFQPN